MNAFVSEILNGTAVMVRKIVLLHLAIALLFGCAGDPAYESRKKMREGFPPEILDHYADRAIRPGAIWHIYLRFKDSDCDMTYVVADIWQSGVGLHVPSYSPITQTGCGEIKGYLALSTPPDLGLVQDQLEFKIFVRDRRGNRSQPINLILNFDYASSEKPPEQWKQAASNRLGAIQIDLRSSQFFQGGAGS